MTPHAERTIAVGERDYCGFRFQGDDLAGGVTVSSGAVTVLPASGLTLASAVALRTSGNDGVYAWVTAVTAGTYDITFAITFSDSKILKRVYRIRVV